MIIIPAINCNDFVCVKEKILRATELFENSDCWVHIDVTDGKFTPHQIWNNPRELAELQTGSYKLPCYMEVHLMVQEPETVINQWMDTAAQRFIVHLETIKKEKHSYFLEEVGFPRTILAIKQETPVKDLVPYLSECKMVSLLAVTPGRSGQLFNPSILEKIKFLKQNHPDVKIEVDGGVNLETAKLIKEAGADIAVSASHIWENANPKEAYKNLTKI